MTNFTTLDVLFRWRFVIHGGIDGYSRMIVFLRANNNNMATAVFYLFLGAVGKFGLPSRVRTDKGGENVDIARYMLNHPLHGPDSQECTQPADQETLERCFLWLYPHILHFVQLHGRLWYFGSF